MSACFLHGLDLHPPPSSPDLRRLDEPNGTIAYDSVGPNNGIYNNVILNKTLGYSVTDADPWVNLQKMPVGQGSFVSVANYQAFNFFTNPSPQFTLEAWAYFTNITGVQRLFPRGIGV